MSSLEDKIGIENPVRFIDAFLEHITLESVGFTVQKVKSDCHPSFGAKVFLKIYLSGYMNELQSSVKIKKPSISLCKKKGDDKSSCYSSNNFSITP